MQRNFVATQGAKLPPKGNPVLRGAGLKPVSQKQALRTARWVGMKDMALYILGADAVCGLCEKPLHSGEIIDADHIVPRSRGGTDEPENLQLVHRPCHKEKHGVPKWKR